MPAPAPWLTLALSGGGVIDAGQPAFVISRAAHPLNPMARARDCAQPDLNLHKSVERNYSRPRTPLEHHGPAQVTAPNRI